MLAIAGEVMPATPEPAALVAEMEDGRVVAGETAVANDRSHVRRLRLEPPRPPAHPAAVTAVREADLLVLGPGSLFTSTLPPLLVPELREAVLTSPARRVYIANLLQQTNETIGYDAALHIDRLVQHVGDGIVDTVVIPTRRRVEADGLIPVDFDRDCAARARGGDRRRAHHRRPPSRSRPARPPAGAPRAPAEARPLLT